MPNTFERIMKVIIIRLQRPESGCWRASGFAWCVRSQVVGIATRRGARDETGARPAHARPAQAMRLTANTKRKP